jgi:hypothetical protein
MDISKNEKNQIIGLFESICYTQKRIEKNIEIIKKGFFLRTVMVSLLSAIVASVLTTFLLT